MKLDELKNIDLRELDIKELGNWPLPVKIGAIVLVCIAVLGAGFWFDTRGQLDDLNAAQQKEAELKKTFEDKQQKSANLAIYRQQMEEMKRSFGTMLRQLPSKTEIAELLVDISQTGLANGLQFDLFKPENEKPAEFYAELPIKIKVTGTYHEFGRFVSGVAQLPRIVTLHDISITTAAAPAKDAAAAKSGSAKPAREELIMEATAKTYRYLEEGAK